MSAATLTKKQKEVLDFVAGYITEMGYAPSYREVAEHFGFSSTATVHEHIKNLEAKGCLKSDPDTVRSLELSPALLRLAKAIELPLMGLITAGAPIEAVETKETVAVPAQLAVDGINSYVLRVKGESMVDDGILSGDYVIVERNPSPSNGDIVVALLDNMYATLKRFYREKDRIRLQPANSTMRPIFVRDVIVQGVVRGVIRDFRSRPI
ncbi:transcriptional repressor LexA [Candidatus Uhrbacteria bacterium]|nr:transcriptional repressor LexA [Candidatus Uhrbacteria bacterium]